MEKMLMFYAATSNIDPMDMVVSNAQQFNYNSIAIRVHDGEKNIAMLDGKDDFLPKVFKHSNDRQIGVYFYVDIKGSDPVLEAKQVCARIELYKSNPSFRGLIVRVADGFAVRSSNAAKVYFDYVENLFPNMELGVMDTTTKKLAFMPAFLSRVDFVCVLSANENITNPWADTVKWYLNYMNWYGMKSNLENPYKFIPTLGIYDMPNRGYKFTRDGSVNWFKALMADTDIMGGAYWNYKPDNGAVPLEADGSSNNKNIEGLVWTKVINTTPEIPPETPETPPVVPETPPIVPPTTPPVVKPELLIGYDYWEGNQVVDEAVIASLIKFVSIRLNDMNGGHHMDTLFATHWNEAKSFPRFPYFVYNPWATGLQNYNWLMANLPSDMCLRIALDIEVRYTGYAPSTYAQQVDYLIDKVINAGLKPVIYTGLWFLPYLSSWRTDVPYWWARYPYAMKPPTSPTTFAQLQRQVEVLKWDPDGSINNPSLPQNQRAPGEVKIWQVSDQWVLPGTSRHAVDINVWKDTYQELLAWINGNVVPPVEPPCEPPVIIDCKLPEMIADIEAVIRKYKE